MRQIPPDRTIQVGDVKTRYWALGRHGPVVICMHGIMRFAEDWLYNIEALAQNHRVYVLDLVGYGCSDKPDIDYSLDDFVSFLHEFMVVLGIERATLIGHSMGGGIALNLAHRHPEKVERLVLAAGAGFGQEVHLALRLASLPMVAELCIHPNRAIISHAFKQVVYDPAIITAEMTALAHQRFYLPQAKEALLKTIRSGVALPGVRAEVLAILQQAIPTITAPVLIIWGRQDPVLPVEHAYMAVESLPNAQVHILDECGHFPMFEHPQVFNALVTEFLNQTISLPLPLSRPIELLEVAA